MDCIASSPEVGLGVTHRDSRSEIPVSLCKIGGRSTTTVIGAKRAVFV